MQEPQIFKATYSGVPVYEMMCKGVAVMRRRADGWLNATQILKVAGFDKPQRTRVLERDVQKGRHEKVQGGYGKYQGTWIPLDRGLVLAKQYNCDYLLRAIIEFQPEAKSPPLAPKHLITPVTGRPPGRRAGDAALPASAPTRSSIKNANDDIPSDSEKLSPRGSEDGSMSPTPSGASSSSPTPSPINEKPESPNFLANDADNQSEQQSNKSGSKRKNQRRSLKQEDSIMEEDSIDMEDNAHNYCEEILEYFISDSNQIPQILISPPPDFDPNMTIDDDGHAALHWASAMGRIRVVKLLITAGADIFKVNKSGQTALMRSVMFANNYDVRKFPELYELLHRSTLNIDVYNRTVFHHILDVAMSKGKTHAARYYMETILQRLAEFPKELADIINFQDEDGETALTMAARCRSKRLVKLLIDHGADPKITNNDHKSTEDYILEDERFRASPVLPSRMVEMSYRNAQAAYSRQNNYSPYTSNVDKPHHLHYSTTAQRASTRCINEMAALMESLAASFDQELKDKGRDMTQAQSLLTNIQSEILESQRVVGQLKAQSQDLNHTQDTLRSMEEQLKVKMTKRYRLGFEKWFKDEEEREASVRDLSIGSSLPQLASHPDATDIGNNDSTSSNDTKGKRKASEDEDISDLTALYADLPVQPEDISKVCQTLREELDRHKRRRKDVFDEFVKLQAEAGTGGRMNQYRRLIGAGCGGIPLSDVDNVISMLLETLESEEPSASSAAWTNSSKPGAVAT